MAKRKKGGASKQRKNRNNDNLSMIQKKMRAAIEMHEEYNELGEERKTINQCLVDEDKGKLFVDAIDLENHVVNVLDTYIEKVENVPAGIYSAKAFETLDNFKDWLINIIEKWPNLAGDEEDTEEDTPVETKAPEGKNGKPKSNKKKQLETAS